MADDPERDLLPVKEGSSFEKQKNVSTFTLDSERDVLHAPYISKLDRNELEDRYMCVMLDNSHLKKECNRQEEKIKRLATKLLRLVAEQKRDIPTAAQRRDHSLECMVGEQQQQIRELQQSNCQLQDRLVVLRNQLVEHTSMHSAVHCTFMGKSRSPARSPARCHARSCTPRSRIEAGVSHDSQNMFQPNSQTNTPHPRNHASPQRPGADVTEDQSRNDEQRPLQVPSSNAAVAQQNQKLSQEIVRLREQISILQQDLETQREQNNVRIGELEDELSNTVARDQRQKVAENVEIIRLKRSLQQQSAHLAAQSAKNQVLEREVVHCQQELEAVQQDSDELHHQLMNERHKVADLQQELQEVGSSRLSIRELQEQIRDIQNERSTLKEHNERLLALMPSRQIQSSEQEVALRSQVRQLESMLANEQNERAQLMERIEQLQSEVEKEQANLEPSLGQENALRIQVAQLEAALSTELKERSNLLEALNELRQKMSEPQSSDKENALHIQQVRQLETTLANELDERTRMLQSLEEERTQVSALKVAHSDLLVKLEDLQAQHSKIENQLETLQQDPRSGVNVHTLPPPNELPQKYFSRMPTFEQSQYARNLHERLTSKPRKSGQVSSSLIFTEDFSTSPVRMEYEKHKNLNASESIPNISSDTSTSEKSHFDRKSSEPSLVTNTGFKKSSEASTQEGDLKNRTVNYCNCGHIPRVLTEGYCACSGVSSLSLNSSHGSEDSIRVPDMQESRNLHTIEEISVPDTEGSTSNSQSGENVLPYDSQLQENKGKSKLIPEEDYHTSAESPGLMIPDQDSLESNEVNMMAVHPGEDRTATANNLDIRRELEKCRELLRVQYNLNSLYKKEVASLANQLSQSEDEQARKMDEMSKLLQMHTTHISKLQSRLETSELDRTAHDSGHLTIGEGEGIFEIHIESLQLPPDELIGLVDKADKLCDVTCDKIELPSLFLTWVFYDQDVAYTPVKRADTNIEFDSSSVHRVTVDDKFLDYLAEDHCIIEVHMAVDDASETVARGTIHFSELLQFPQNKIHSTVPLAGTRSHEATAGFGIMQCWFRLSCSVNLVSSYVQHRMADKVSRSKVPIPAPRQKKEQISHLDSNKRPENVITTGSPLRTHEGPGDKVGELETESQTRTHEEPGDKDGELETESQASLEELERESFKRSIHEMSAIKVQLNNSFPKVAEIHVKNIN